ncbi:MFS transporter [Pelagicoccus mobilis]|uniref:MFS transporter n=1 Tax=Pelagicoccus mobilis TaxID=415221 RepID=A0A934RVY0_9BACT|nr:MFS transporter [Pelagicoccus mobilis]MBK1878725.1 MFS transporter [Pelagicoccus mobilis]
MSKLKDGKLSVGEKVAYGLGDTASNFYFQFFNMFLFYYYTDVFGLAAGAVGIMMTATRVFDAVTDPLMGVVADRTESRWGKFRPYILWGAIPYGILGYAMFANPDLSDSGKLIYAYITYSLTWLIFTIINIPYSAMMGVMTPNPAERTVLSSYRFVFAFGGGFLISLFVLPLKEALGGDDPADGFRRTMMLFATCSVLMFFVTFWFCKERVNPPKSQNSSLKEDLGMLILNKPWLVMVFVSLLNLTGSGMRGASGMYYFTYIVGDEAKATFFMSSGMAMFIVGSMSAAFIIKVIPRRTLMIALPILSGIATLAFWVADPSQYWLILGLNMLASLLMGPTPAIVWSFYADAADWGEWKHGRRATALVFSASTFAIKISLAIGSGLLGLILTQYGFVANQDQTETAKLGIMLSFAVYPGILTILSGLVIFFYPLKERDNKQIEEELNERRVAAGDAEPEPSAS